MRRALLTLLACALCATPAVAGPWVVSTGETIFPSSEAGERPISEMRLFAGRGEVEGAIVALRPVKRARITPVTSDLVSSDGTLTIPRERITVSRIGYVPMKRTSTGVSRLESDEYPDPIYEIPARKATTLPADTTTPILVEVDVPIDQAPGVYTGAVTFGAQGRVPMSIEVIDVAVDRDRRPFVSRIDVYAVGKHYGVAEDDPRLLEGLVSHTLPMLRAHGINPGQIPGSAPRMDLATWTPDWSGAPADRLARGAGQGFPFIEMPYLPYYNGMTDRTYKNPRRIPFARALADVYRPLATTSFAMPIDEPREDEYRLVRRAAGQLQRAGSPAKIMVTEAPSDKAVAAMNGVVDIWNPPLWSHYTYRARMQSLRANGKQTWWYLYGSDVQRHAPNLLIDKPLTEPRVIGWLAEQEEMGATYYWSLTAYRHGKTGVRNPSRTPWRISHRKKGGKCENGGRQVGGNGEGTLMYPSGNLTRPLLRSLRMVAVRDGLEDQALIRALKERDPAAAQRVAEATARAFSGPAGSVCSANTRPPSLPVFLNDPAEVQALRMWMIDRLQGRAGTTLAGTVTHRGEPVRGATVRAGGILTVTDAKGRFRLGGMPAQTLAVTASRDREGRVDVADLTVTSGEMVAADAGTLELPALALPERTERHLQVSPGDLRAWSTRAGRSRTRVVNGTVELRLAHRYAKSGISATRNQAADVRRTFTGRKADWRKFRALRLTINLVNPGPESQPWRLLVTPCGPYDNTRRLLLAPGMQQVEIPLTGMRGLGAVSCVDLGVRSALPPSRRGGHYPQALMRLRDVTLVR